ncbi:MAG TPA: alpha-L-rhamnosidase N-terminal domain-containing protein [Rariglobus sp.]|nr:alpha-L-rhamnosidase N-terminal domain-containing protein [Rariglobus sp.]
MFSDSFWIWPDNHHWDIHNSYALFRKSFELKKVPAKAPLFITADQSYQLYVNGSYVCRGPARGFQHHWSYDEADVGPYLRPGRNVIAVRAHNPGFSNFQYVTQGNAGLLVAAKWGATRIVSDKSWKCRRQSGVLCGTVPTSLQLFNQEHIDLREEDPRWMEPSFDDRDWKSEAATAFSGVMPWNQLEPRGIPLLDENLIGPARCIGTAKGRCTDNYAATRDAARLRHAEGLAHSPCDFFATEIQVETTGKKRFRSYLLDFGRTVVGSVGFQIFGAAGGEILDTLHAETIDADTLTPHYTPDKHSRMAFAHRLVCRPGDQSHTFYHTFGFRYMVITVRDSTRALIIRPHLRSTLYPLVQNGAFTSSDTGLNKIWNACAWTQRVCSMDAYVDTPWREQAQWWGDSRVQAKTTFFYSGDTRLFRRGLAQIAAQTAPNGLTYGHAPTMAHSCILPDFSLVWLITLWDFYWQTGSAEPLLTHQKTIDGILGYFEDYTAPKTGLVGFDKRYWLFLDWTGLFKDGYSTVYNLWLLIALERLSAMYGRTNRPDAAKKLAAWAKRLRKALGQVVREDGLLCDGLTFAGKRVEETSIHAQTLAMIAGFQSKQNAQRIRDVLLPFIRQETKPAIYPSCYWITYVFEALTTAGHGAEVIRFIREKWTPMAEYGTTWELFEPRVGDESFSHAWSAHPLFHLMQTIGGIRQSASKWTEIIYEPVFEGELNKTVVPTPHGKIRSVWKRSGAQIKVTLTLPKGVSATIRLPGQKQTVVRGASSWVIKSLTPHIPGFV